MKTDIFYAMNEIDDKYVTEAAKRIEKSNRSFIFRHGHMLAAAAALVFVIVLNIANPALARSIPFIGSVFESIQNQLDLSGPYSNYSTNIETTAKSSGITVTLKETYCDGENLFVSYQIESEKAFSDYVSKPYVKTQLDFDATLAMVTEDKVTNIDDFGVSGLEGEFTDNHTFIGVDTLRLEEEFADDFIFEIQIYNWNLLLNDGSEKAINGYWKLSAPISVNEKDIETINVNMTEKQHSIDKVVVSPVMITVYTSYPEIYNDSVDYEVIIFSDKSDDDVSFQGNYGRTEGKTWIPREMVGDTLDIYVVDSSTFTLTGAAAYTKEEIEKHAIVSTHINLKTEQR